MVYGTYNYSIHGVYKPIYNVWGHHIVGKPSISIRAMENTMALSVRRNQVGYLPFAPGWPKKMYRSSHSELPASKVIAGYCSGR